MKRIAFLSHIDINLYLFRLHLLTKLKENAWDVFAIIPYGKYFDKFPQYGVKAISYNITRGSLNPLREIKVIFTIQRLLRLIRPYILHTYVVKSNIYGSIAARFAHTPVVINSITGLGSFYIEDTKRSKTIRNIIEALYRFAFSYSKKIIFQNPDDLRYFIKKLIIPSEKAYLIRGSGIDIEKFRSISYKTDGKFRVTLVSRLIKHKGIVEFCEAAKTLAKRYSNIEFLLVGDFYDGNPYSVSRDYIEKLHKKGIINFLGWRDDVKELIGASHLLVLPSYREGLPNTPLEAMAMEKPIIVTDTVGCKEVIEDGINGKKIPIKDTDILIWAIDTIYRNRAFAKKAGKYGRKKAEVEFSKDRVTKAHIRLYEDMI